jgi:hypothetical protein
MKTLEGKLSKLEDNNSEEKSEETDALNVHPQLSEHVPATNCSCCQKCFQSISDLKYHNQEKHGSKVKQLLKFKLEGIEHALVVEKVQLYLKVAKLREKETNEMKCHCRNVCRISH